MKTTEPIIETGGLTKVYGANGTAVHALRGIDMSVGAGEFLALIGPSGSGKSTLMAILGCLDSPTAGSYRFDGEQVDLWIGAREDPQEKIGFVVPELQPPAQGFRLATWSSRCSTRAWRAMAGGRRDGAPGELRERWAPPCGRAAGAGALWAATTRVDDRPGRWRQPPEDMLLADSRPALSTRRRAAKSLAPFQELHAEAHDPPRHPRSVDRRAGGAPRRDPRRNASLLSPKRRPDGSRRRH
jgi:energy-coupling factor transporter ATP-binding protein EcfA2